MGARRVAWQGLWAAHGGRLQATAYASYLGYALLLEALSRDPVVMVVVGFAAAGVLAAGCLGAVALLLRHVRGPAAPFVARLPGMAPGDGWDRIGFASAVTALLAMVGGGLGFVWLQLHQVPWRSEPWFVVLGPSALAAVGMRLATLLALVLPLAGWLWWRPAPRPVRGALPLVVALLAAMVWAGKWLQFHVPELLRVLGVGGWLGLAVLLLLGLAAAVRGAARQAAARRHAAPWVAGLGAAAVLVAAGAALLGEAAQRFYRFDPAALRIDRVVGITPAGDYLLADGPGAPWRMVRVELATGRAEPVGGLGSEFHPPAEFGLGNPVAEGRRRRHWLGWDRGGRYLHLDLENGAVQDCMPLSREIRFAPGDAARLPAAVRESVLAEQRARSPFRDGTGRRLWLDGDRLFAAAPQGPVVVHRFDPPLDGLAEPAGHALRLANGALFDFATGTWHDRGLLAEAPHLAVRGVVLYRWGSGFDPFRRSELVPWSGWGFRALPEGRAARVSLPAWAELLGLIDDDRVLVVSQRINRSACLDLFTYTPATDRLEPWLGASVEGRTASWAGRDPAGRIWLGVDNRDLVGCDPAACIAPFRLAGAVDREAGHELIALPDAEHVLLRQDDCIVRVRLADQRLDVLFPRR